MTLRTLYQSFGALTRPVTDIAETRGLMACRAVVELHTSCRGRQLGDPPFPGQRGMLVANCLWFLPLGFPRGEAAERSEADEGWRQVGS